MKKETKYSKGELNVSGETQRTYKSIKAGLGILGYSEHNIYINK